MKKLFFFYIMSVGATLSLFATYFSILLPQYINSIFFIIDMILISSIFIFLLINNKDITTLKSILILNLLFMIFFFSLTIMNSLFTLPSELYYVFISFFTMTSMVLSILLSVFLFYDKEGTIFAFFSPLFLFSLALLFINFFNISLPNFYHNFISLFSTIYLSLYLYFSFSFVNKLVSGKRKFYSVFLSLFLINLSFSLFVLDVASYISPILSLIGTFALCLAVVEGSDLNLYSTFLNKMISHLKGKPREAFLSYLKRLFSKHDELKVRFKKDSIELIDNQDLPNSIEARLYGKVISLSVKWYKKNIKSSTKFISNLKKEYKYQLYLLKKAFEILY